MKRAITALIATVGAVAALIGFKTTVPEVASNAPESTNALTAVASTPVASGSDSGPVGGGSATGDLVETDRGPVQVKVTKSGSKITKIDVVEYPKDSARAVSINTKAVPTLVTQALSAQSANIDGASGATYTTQGFKTSLQSALNKL